MNKYKTHIFNKGFSNFFNNQFTCLDRNWKISRKNKLCKLKIN